MYIVSLILFVGIAATQASDPDIIYGPKPVGCILPPYPEHGTYAVNRIPSARPGQIIESVLLRYKCDDGYGIDGLNEIFCEKGLWSLSLPTCIPIASSLTSGADAIKGGKNASSDVLYNECGTLSVGRELRDVTLPGKIETLPWAAAIFSKTYKPYEQICGGSLVTNNAVISAAICFWQDEKLDAAENYAVALGKKYRPWSENRDDAQKSDVKAIHVPEFFKGQVANYQNNIALVILQTAVTFNPNVRPVCLSFNEELNKELLQEGNLGTFGGWGQKANGELSQVIKTGEIPYVSLEKCIQEAPPAVRPFFTADVFCAGNFESEIGRGDSGVGLSFRHIDEGTQRFYLRGIVSVKPTSPGSDTPNGTTLFTDVAKHIQFIKQYV